MISVSREEKINYLHMESCKDNVHCIGRNRNRLGFQIFRQ